MNDYRQRDRRKSTFVEVSSSQATDRFDLVRNGQNAKISQANLLKDFGVTGSLVSVGEPSAIPVLNAIDTINYIRALIGGSGISTSISAQGGIQIKHNFEVDKGGVPIMLNETALSPTMVSLEAGAGISIGASGKSIQIALSSTPPSTKTVIIYEEADFPTPVGDLITLAPDTYYQIVADITTANRLLFQEGTILAGSDYIITLAYSGVGIFLNATDVNCKVVNLTVAAPTGTIFGMTDDGTHFFRSFLSNYTGLNVGNFNEWAAVIFNNSNFGGITGQGITMSGNFSIFIFETVGLTIPSGTGNGITLGTATFDYLLIDKGLWEVDTTGYSLSGLADSGNINVGGLGTIVNSRNFGSADPVDNISPFDDRWEFQLNAEVPNSADVCMATHAGATIAIAGANTPVIIGATWLAVDEHRFTATVGGRFTYNGKGSHVDMDLSLSGDAATATHTYAFYIYKNGVQVPASIVTREFTAGNIGNISLIWSDLLETGDYIELWVENQTGAADFVLDAATFRLRGS